MNIDEIKLIQEVHQAVLGIPHTDNNGLCGEIKAIKLQLEDLNGQVARNTVFRKVGTWLSAAISTSLILLLVKLLAE